MKILSNNVIGREKVVFLKNSYMNRGWAKRNYTSKYGSGFILERVTNVGKITRRIESIKVSVVDLTNEIVVNDKKVEYEGIDSVLGILSLHLRNGLTMEESITKCKEDEIIDDNDIINLKIDTIYPKLKFKKIG